VTKNISICRKWERLYKEILKQSKSYHSGTYLLREKPPAECDVKKNDCKIKTLHGD